jgi:restriction endonuclease Mrr
MRTPWEEIKSLRGSAYSFKANAEEELEQGNRRQAISELQEGIECIEVAIDIEVEEDVENSGKPPVNRPLFQELDDERLQFKQKLESIQNKQSRGGHRNQGNTKGPNVTDGSEPGEESDSIGSSGTNLKGISNRKLLSYLEQVDPYEFEKLVADIWAHLGYQTQVSKQSSDRGIDIEATKSGMFQRKELIQAKRYVDGNKVGSREVQQYASLKYQEENVDVVAIVTTGRFTGGAKRRARDLNVKLVNGLDLVGFITENELSYIVEERLGQEANF